MLKLLRFGKNPSVGEVAQKTVQKAKTYFNVRKGEHVAQGIKLRHSPATDEFVDFATAQNANIIGDVVTASGARCITIKLPSGTTICKAFDKEGVYKGKEVITQNSRSVYERNNLDPKFSTFYFERNNGESIYGRAGDVYRNPVPIDYGQKSSSLRAFDGMTARVNQ